MKVDKKNKIDDLSKFFIFIVIDKIDSMKRDYF